MPIREMRSLSREFKLEAVRRIESGENVSALARELTVKREIFIDGARPAVDLQVTIIRVWACRLNPGPRSHRLVADVDAAFE